MTSLWRSLLYAFPAVILFFVLLPFYFVLKRKGEAGQSLIVKGLCTLVPVVFCLNGCLTEGYPAFWWMLAGMLLYLAGDIAIEKNVFAGIACLTAGHLLFIVAFLWMASPRLLCLPVMIAVLLFAGILFRKPLRQMRKRAVPFLLYAIVLSALFALTLNLPNAAGTALMSGGAFLLILSDILLARSRLSDKRKFSARCDLLHSVFFYAALYLFALSVWL